MYCPKCMVFYEGSESICRLCKSTLVDSSSADEDMSGTGQQQTQDKDTSNLSEGSTTFVWGIFILIAGIIGFFLSAPKMDAMRSGWGQLAAGLNQNVASEFQMWQTVYYGSIIALVIGVLVILVGIIKPAIEK